MARVSRLSALALFGALLWLAAPAAEAGHKDGERIEVTGLVTDPSGRPLSQLSVVLEATRGGFSLRQFQRTKKEPTRVMGWTNERGEFSLEWPWNRYYNGFELLVGIPVQRPDGEHLKVLARVDLSQKMKLGNPVVSAVMVSDFQFVESLRAFLASIESEDQRRLYEQMGAPDKVERVEHPEHNDISWWYFEAGKLYHFSGGKLVKTESFAPVKEF